VADVCLHFVIIQLLMALQMLIMCLVERWKIEDDFEMIFDLM